MSSLFAPLVSKKQTPKSGLFASIPSQQSVHAPPGSRECPESPDVPMGRLSGRVLYLSGRVELLSLPDGERLWFGLNESWYRRMDAHGYLWLFRRFCDHFFAQSESSPEIPDLLEVGERFSEVKRLGIDRGAFTERQVHESQAIPKTFNWLQGYPHNIHDSYFSD